MEKDKIISGFSKLSKKDKIKWLTVNFFKDPELVVKELSSYWHSNEAQQNVIDGFSENTVSNFVMPYGIAPNFLIDGNTYAIPMVIEESSVVAAASAAAKFWLGRGGFNTKIVGTTKVGHVHFKWNGPAEWLYSVQDQIFRQLKEDTNDVTARMEQRGGGITRLSFIDLNEKMPGLFQLKGEFETCDSMGANFINSVLEQFAISLKNIFSTMQDIPDSNRDIEVIMSILSNYTPECVVKAWVECPIADLGTFNDETDAKTFANKFYDAIKIAELDPYRATTHNKGIFNGIDAVVLATGNDFRAIEACGHAYASRNGSYSSLSHCSIDDNVFRFELEVPLAIGTVGGLTALHPMAKRSLEMMDNPTAQELMSIIASVGLAQNFAAVKSLVTTGIQQGHMKMHLQNILNFLNASQEEIEETMLYFDDKTVSHSAVVNFVGLLRN